jgi:hypothetical protein
MSAFAVAPARAGTSADDPSSGKAATDHVSVETVVDCELEQIGGRSSVGPGVSRSKAQRTAEPIGVGPEIGD